MGGSAWRSGDRKGGGPRAWGMGLLLVALLPAACDLSYPSSGWGDQPYDHARISGGFQLLGVHSNAPCTNCHAPGNYEPLFQPSDGSDCQACHLSDREPNHTALGYPADCSFCHTPTVWTGASFDHTALTGGFGLTEIHATLPCTSCHLPVTFEPIFDPEDANDCRSCHLGSFPAGHEGRGYPTDCSYCHTPTAWGEGVLDHSALSGGFELLGIHMAFRCTTCHVPGSFEPIFDPEDATDCAACHQALYDRVHVGSGYPTTCFACHTPSFWSDGEFNHSEISDGFDLLGAHSELACTLCHVPGSFEPIFDPEDTNDCLSCHLSDYQGQHLGTGFPLTCLSCHTTDTWSGVELDHKELSGGFDLVGVHVELDCTRCHSEGDFSLRFDPKNEADCLACHQADYDAQHLADGYPTTCTSCHAPTAWEDADFDHDRDYFPIFTGDHAPRWATCATCHTDPDDFREFTCFTCHFHNQSNTDKRHEDEPGYSYTPSACISCHPAGEA